MISTLNFKNAKIIKITVEIKIRFYEVIFGFLHTTYIFINANSKVK